MQNHLASSYADECDRLSELEAVRESENGSKVWGRWFLSDGMLATWVILPKTGVVSTEYKYEISLKLLTDETTLSVWLECLRLVDWIGKDGYLSLAKAFKFLTNKIKSGKIKIENEVGIGD